MSNTQSEYTAYCLFCKTGSEQKIAGRIEKTCAALAYSPVRVKSEYKNGTWTTRNVALLPGYVFIYVIGDAPFSLIRSFTDVLGFLEYGDGTGELYGNDLKIALWVLQHKGAFGLSKALRIGERIKIVEGPLMEYEGTLSMVNKQKRLAKVDIVIGNTAKTLWLSFEWVEATEN